MEVGFHFCEENIGVKPSGGDVTRRKPFEGELLLMSFVFVGRRYCWRRKSINLYFLTRRVASLKTSKPKFVPLISWSALPRPMAPSTFQFAEKRHNAGDVREGSCRLEQAEHEEKYTARTALARRAFLTLLMCISRR